MPLPRGTCERASTPSRGPSDEQRRQLAQIQRLISMNQILELDKLIQAGPFVRAQKVVLFGPEAVGKSTLASKFPHPIFIDCEDGSLRIDTRRIRATDGDTFTTLFAH